MLVLNENSNHSEHVKSETNLAFRRVNKKEQITLVPFKVDNCVLDDDVDYYLSRFHITDGTPTDERSIRELAQQISHILGSEAPKAAQSQTPATKSKSALLVYVVLACMVLLLVCVIVYYQLKEKPIMEINSTEETWWTLDGNHLFINYVGDMLPYGPAEYSSDNVAPWTDNRAQIAALTIADSVTGIGSYSFDHCPVLASVTIPDTVTYIGEGAFSYCTGLTHVNIPNSVTNIGDGVFQGCTALTSAYIPDSVIRIGNNAFANCASLSSISVLEGTDIAPDAFPNSVIIETRPNNQDDATTPTIEIPSIEDYIPLEPEELWKIQHGQ